MRRAACLLAALLPLLTGCGKSEQQVELVPVEGKITVNGQPLSYGTIVFKPDASKGNKSKQEARATLDNSSDGAYALKTGDRPGAVPGWYRVTIFAAKPGSSTEPTVWLANQMYQNAETSGLALEVVPAAPGAGRYDLDLKP